ncbi:hypothetical protein AOC36_02650 [Erysipelothrix larvae]|uniref:Permease n=1 Tax=Erysipelothrix larvae TaxID=1514105 RepID=A0A0X8GYU1_9FIRM|nr:DUF979 domain-containing protein [Erysipelothrix larvae]AMC92922.1 hypothetical protein AOC36_02650 [Erysipelothrix larvae]
MTYEAIVALFNNWQEIIFALTGLVCISAAVRALKTSPKPYGTFSFWFIIALIFMFGGFVNTTSMTEAVVGKPIPASFVGFLILILGVLSATGQVKVGTVETAQDAEIASNANRVGLWVFVPALVLAFFAAGLSMLQFNYGDKVATIPGGLSVGVASLLALLAAFIISRAKVKETQTDTDRLVMQVGSASILPQLLSALGAVFTAAGVGDVISAMFSGIIPEGNVVMGVIMYVLGMVIFTMIMGNAFAAFQVITIGVGIPFVIAAGGNPAVVGALALTGGYCGTLLTPMAANFNALPVSVLDMKDKYGVIKAQVPFALVMIVIHIVLMLLLAF